MLENVQCIRALDIPSHLADSCLDIDDEFPLHYANGLVQILEEHRNNEFVIWLVKQGFIIDSESEITWLGVWGT